MSTHIHEYRKKQAIEAIDALFSDASVGPDETAASLHELRDEINAKLNTLAAEESVEGYEAEPPEKNIHE